MRTVNRRIVTLLTGLGLSLVFGCDSGSGADNANTCDVGDLSAVCSGGAPNAVTLSDAYNFTFESTLHMSSTVVKGAAELVDLTFDWSGVTQDFIGRTIDPLADIDMAHMWDDRPGEAIPWFESHLSETDVVESYRKSEIRLLEPSQDIPPGKILRWTMYGLLLHDIGEPSKASVWLERALLKWKLINKPTAQDKEWVRIIESRMP